MDRNEEKLKILQERLRQIKEKDENISSSNNIINQSSTHKNIGNDISEKSSPKSSKSKSYIFISFLLVFALAFVISKNYDNIKFDFNVNFDKNDNVVNNEVKEEKDSDIQIEKKYDIDKFTDIVKGEIAVVLNLSSEEEAINTKNELISKGFKARYFFSSDYSNISDESYEILIGPYETENELNQWLNNINTKSITRISL
tara:strand:+ start:4424 stop:5023 length:600 start_codon:yes stop_codon:yes gene_type:complete